MVLARKKRGGAPPPPPDLTGGHPFESPANPRKKRFGDESDDDGGDDETQMEVRVPGERASSSSFAERPRCRSGAGHHSRAIAADGRRAPTPSHALRGVLPSAKTRLRRRVRVDGLFRAPAPAVARDLPHVEDGQPCRRCAGGSARGRRRAAPENARADGRGADRAAAARTWCGGYQLGCDKNALKCSTDETLRHTQKWLVRHNSTGVLTRQAVDSMVPAAILGVEPHHRVLDLCASPGSKTTQALELRFFAPTRRGPNDSRFDSDSPSGCGWRTISARGGVTFWSGGARRSARRPRR